MKKLIELDAAIEAMAELQGRAASKAELTGISKAWERIKALPLVDAVLVRHGRWIDIDSEMYTWKIRCNKCGHERSMMSTGQIYPMYCENCGARMDGDHQIE